MMRPFQALAAKKKPAQLRFVESVRVRNVSAPLKVNWRYLVLTVFWFLIGVKCLLAHWAIVHWEMPFASAYVWAPTVFAALLCTIVFLASGNDEERKN